MNFWVFYFLGYFQYVCYSLAVNTLVDMFGIETEYYFVNMLFYGNSVITAVHFYLQTLKVVTLVGVSPDLDALKI